jgi:hypothetical protein
MRANFEVQDDLLCQAEALAAKTGRTLGQVVEDALRTLFQRSDVATSRGPAELPTFGGSGLHAGVDLDDSAALLDLMERGSRFPGLELEHPSGPENAA